MEMELRTPTWSPLPLRGVNPLEVVEECPAWKFPKGCLYLENPLAQMREIIFSGGAPPRSQIPNLPLGDKPTLGGQWWGASEWSLKELRNDSIQIIHDTAYSLQILRSGDENWAFLRPGQGAQDPLRTTFTQAQTRSISDVRPGMTGGMGAILWVPNWLFEAYCSWARLGGMVAKGYPIRALPIPMVSFSNSATVRGYIFNRRPPASCWGSAAAYVKRFFEEEVMEAYPSLFGDDLENKILDKMETLKAWYDWRHFTEPRPDAVGASMAWDLSPLREGLETLTEAYRSWEGKMKTEAGTVTATSARFRLLQELKGACGVLKGYFLVDKGHNFWREGDPYDVKRAVAPLGAGQYARFDLQQLLGKTRERQVIKIKGQEYVLGSLDWPFVMRYLEVAGSFGGNAGVIANQMMALVGLDDEGYKTIWRHMGNMSARRKTYTNLANQTNSNTFAEYVGYLRRVEAVRESVTIENPNDVAWWNQATMTHRKLYAMAYTLVPGFIRASSEDDVVVEGRIPPSLLVNLGMAVDFVMWCRGQNFDWVNTNGLSLARKAREYLDDAEPWGEVWNRVFGPLEARRVISRMRTDLEIRGRGFFDAEATDNIESIPFEEGRGWTVAEGPIGEKVPAPWDWVPVEGGYEFRRVVQGVAAPVPAPVPATLDWRNPENYVSVGVLPAVAPVIPWGERPPNPVDGASVVRCYVQCPLCGTINPWGSTRAESGSVCIPCAERHPWGDLRELVREATQDFEVDEEVTVPF